ncbi:COBW domain-containing protein 1 [Coemansia spiralis]|uniref:COBW domain-containing protein 1 n=2 Tax=Coemansia TaxID=4863 RepID=A0A9W8KVK1_9FUNG|nr:CobW/HypB/UreG, nucleotide-binding domain-containing protein [Coemansia spiralis]KAJ1990290.1 COBW domain-containing protein 1 [Coemansia umbellata]KAJ2619262.1 COBW domain-containing protein 1 [Coemansia sp. RSA 1358]KAJ2674169.1 COBW domain-containing protein 1 [Coemansia spiralis]
MNDEIPVLVEELPELVPATSSLSLEAKQTDAAVDNTASSSDDIESGDRDKVVPATILTGYLGSGKTTLLNYILTEEHGKRIAVIMNEFGDSQGIDQSFTSVSNGEMVEEWLDLKNGCLCCTVKDKGLKAIETLMERKGKFDYILLETTGLADPGRIAAMLWSNEELGSDIRLDGIVTMVDAKNIYKQLSEAVPKDETMNEAQKQIAFADRIVLNKTDLVTESELVSIESTIASINGTARVSRSSYAKVELDSILSINAYSDVGQETPAFAKFENGHSHQHIDGSISTMALNAPARLSWTVVDEWIQELLWDARIPGANNQGNSDNGIMEILRLKALLQVTDYKSVGNEESIAQASVVVQGVREMYDSFVVSDPDSSTPSLYKLVLIGRNIPQESLRNSWKSLITNATVALKG